MKVYRTPTSMQRTALAWQRGGTSVGLVPTMGALHRGHLSLIEKARQQCEVVVVSIYVNPTQFNQAADLKRYPRTWATDRAACQKMDVDTIFFPTNLYEPDHSTWVEETELSLGRCGSARPGHFRGVTTVVLKLVQIVQPNRLYMGWKDAQQLEVITRMLRDLHVPTKIVGCPLVRDPDGLALSSRNQHLSPKERQLALALPRGLKEAVSKVQPVAWLKRHLQRQPGLKLDYVEAANGRLAAAVWVGKTRLIDNRPLRRVQRKASSP